MTNLKKITKSIHERRCFYLETALHPFVREGERFCELLSVTNSYFFYLYVFTPDEPQGLSGLSPGSLTARIKKKAGEVRKTLLTSTYFFTDPSKRYELPLSGKSNMIELIVIEERPLKMPLVIQSKDGHTIHILSTQELEFLNLQLDTLADFLHYLGERANLIGNNTELNFESEILLLGYYIHLGRSFTSLGSNVKLLNRNIWEQLMAGDFFRDQWDLHLQSHNWEMVFYMLMTDLHTGKLPPFISPDMVTRILELMIAENRNSRIAFVSSFLDFISGTHEQPGEQRLAFSTQQPGLAYIFLHHINLPDHLKPTECLGRAAMAKFYYPQIAHFVFIISGPDWQKPFEGVSSFYIYLEKLTEQEKTDLGELAQEKNLFAGIRGVYENPPASGMN